MIKVNLLKKAKSQNEGGKSGKSLKMDFDFLKSDETVPAGNVLALFPKILLILSFSAGLRGYSFYKITTLNKEKEGVQKILDGVLAENATVKKRNKKLKEDKSTAEIFRDKIIIFEKISNLRLHEIRALDYLQDIIPDGVWLKNIQYQDAQNKFVFTGFGEIDEAVNSFVAKLESNPYFIDVILVQSREVKVDKASLKSFTVQSTIAVKKDEGQV